MISFNTILSPVRGAANRVGGLIKGVQSRARGPKDLDDVTLARKVETEIFRGPDAPKGKVDVNAVDGVVELRGEVKRPEQVKAIEKRVRAIPEVRDVNNLLHLPKTPARTRADSPGRQRRRSASKAASEGPRRTQRVSDDQTAKAADAEPSPDDLAAKREGRKAAPLGTGEPGEPGEAGES